MGQQKITNRFDLPQTLVDACKHDSHRVSGDISVTQLIDGPQVRILKRKHDYETDVVDNLYAMMGTALHHILERANMPEVRKNAFILTAETLIAKAEEIQNSHAPQAEQLQNAARYLFSLLEHFFPEGENPYLFEKTLQVDLGDFILYGTFDLYDKRTGILYDYKFCSVFNWIYPEARKKWKAQTNIYAFMLIQNGYPVNGIKVVAFFRDWSEHGLIRNKDYPDTQVKEINIELKTPEFMVQFITERIALHRSAEQGMVPDCTGEDRWAEAEAFAIKTPTGKKAHRILPTKELAIAYIQENNAKFAGELFSEYRPGSSKRCAKYCQVSKFCPQYQREVEILKNQGL